MEKSGGWHELTSGGLNYQEGVKSKGAFNWKQRQQARILCYSMGPDNDGITQYCSCTVGHSPQRLQSGVEVGKYVLEEAQSLQLGEAA